MSFLQSNSRQAATSFLFFLVVLVLGFLLKILYPQKAPYFSENCEKKHHCHKSVQVFSSDLLRYPKSRHVFLSLSCLPSLPGNYKAKEIFRSKKQWGRTRWEHCGWYSNLLKGCSKLAHVEGEKTCCREMGFCLVQDDNGSDKDFESFVLASW